MNDTGPAVAGDHPGVERAGIFLEATLFTEKPPRSATNDDNASAGKAGLLNLA